MQRQDLSDDSDEKVESIIPVRNHTAMEFNGPVQFAAGIVHGGIHHHHHNNLHLPREVEAKEPIPAFFKPDIPFFAENHFVKRRALLEKISSAFLPHQHATQNWRPMTALTAHGLGGVGKTQLALYYYYHSPKSYSFRCWFPAERLDIVYRMFCKKFKIEIDEKASIEEISKEVKQWLEEHPGWLLVYDNVTDCNSIAPHLPTTGGDVLVTSRHTQEWDQIGGREVFVDIVNEEEAIELVKRALFQDERPGLLAEQEEINLKELARELGYLPLALAQAAAYIRKCPGMTITSYLNKYRGTPDIYLNQGLNSRSYSTSVAKTWLITMEEIEKRLPAALPVFKACAYLAPDAIPVQLLSQLILELNPAITEGKEEENEEDKIKNNPLLDEILICLSGFSMIGHDKKTGCVNIHRLIQIVIHQEDKKLFSTKECFEWRLKPLSQALLKIVFWGSKSNDSFEYYSTKRILQSNFEIVTTIFESLQLEGSELVLLANLYDTLGSILGEIVGNAQRAVNYHERALEIMKVYYKEDNVEIARILVNLSFGYGFLGNYAKKRDLLENALVIMKEHDGKNHKEIAKTLCDLGNTYGSLGDYQKMRDYLEDSLKIMESHYQEDYLNIAEIFHALSNAYGLLGDYQRQCDYLECALQINEAYDRKNHIHVAKILHSLGNVYGSLGNYEKGRGYLERALEISEAHYDDKNHVEIAKVRADLGAAYDVLGDYARGRDYLESALNVQEAYYGENSVDITKTLNNLANVYGSLHDYTRKRDLLKRALEIEKTYYGENHVELSQVLTNLGDLYNSLEDYEKASNCLQQALKIKEVSYGKDHLNLSSTLNSLGDVYFSRDQYVNAGACFERALKIYKRQNATNHGSYAITLYNLSKVHESLGNHTKRHDCLEHALNIFMSVSGYGEQHPHTQIIISQLASMSSTVVQSEKTNEPVRTLVRPEEREEKQKQVGGFFGKEQSLLKRLIKKYKLLDDNQSSLEKGLRNAAANGNLEDIELFARYVKNLNAQDENPKSLKTAVHWAAVNGHEDCYNFLVVEKKVEINIPDASNKTANEYRKGKRKEGAALA